MCEDAVRQGETVPTGKYGRNCNFIGDGILFYGRPGEMTCERRSSVFKTLGFTWGQMERHFTANDLDCNQTFLYGIMMREPMSLMRSIAYFDFHLHRVLGFIEFLQGRVDEVAVRNKDGRLMASWKFFDNFMVRSLNGIQGWSKPPRGVDMQDLESAKRRIDALDVVMLLEKLNNHTKQLEVVFGWQPLWNSKRVNRNKASKKEFWVGDVYKFFYDVNVYDRMLYSFAIEVADRKTGALSIYGPGAP